MLCGLFWPHLHRVIVTRRPVMAAARDQAARAIRTEPETAEGESARAAAGQLADQLRTQLAEETKRRPADAPGTPAADKPGAPAAAATEAAPKSGKRKTFVMLGVVGLLALAAVAYGVY